MAGNALRGQAALKAAAQTFKLVFDINAFCLAQQQLGKTTDEIMLDVDRMTEAQRAGKMGATDVVLIRGLIWAGLQQHHECHVFEAGEIIATAGIGPAREAMMRGLGAAFGLAVEGEDGPRPPRRKKPAGTG